MDTLNSEELFSLIQEILTGKKFVYLEHPFNKDVCFIYPSSHIKLYGEFLEDKNKKKYLSDGYISEKEVDALLGEEFFTLEDQELLEDVQSKIKTYQTLLKKRAKGSEQYVKDSAVLDKYLNEQKILISKRSQVKQFSAEFRAREDKYLYLLVNSVFESDGLTPCWGSYDSLINSTIYNINDTYYILNLFLDFYFGQDTKALRQIARSPEWRAYYLSAKDGVIKLFNQEVKELSINQINLISWSKWYENIYEMSLKDRPDPEIIADDEKLDMFIEEYTRKIQADASLNKRKEGRQRALDEDHVVVTAESSNYVKFHKQKAYSDTELISRRSKSESDTTYNESKEYKEIKRKIKK